MFFSYKTEGYYSGYPSLLASHLSGTPSLTNSSRPLAAHTSTTVLIYFHENVHTKIRGWFKLKHNIKLSTCKCNFKIILFDRCKEREMGISKIQFKRLKVQDYCKNARINILFLERSNFNRHKNNCKERTFGQSDNSTEHGLLCF